MQWARGVNGLGVMWHDLEVSEFIAGDAQTVNHRWLIDVCGRVGKP